MIASAVEEELVREGAIWLRIRPLKFPLALLKDWEFARHATRITKKNRDRFDIIHAFGYSLDLSHHVNSAQFVHAAWLKSACHTSRMERNAYGLYHWLYSALNVRWEKKAFLQAKKVVACSALVKRELLDVGVPSDRIHVILNATDPEEFKPGFPERAKMGLPEGVVLALFAGDIRTPRKNLETVLYALRLVPNLHLAVVGATEGSPYLELAKRLGVSPRVHFLGFRKDVAHVMRGVDIFVFPSRYEPFGLVVLEAMASGLAVVSAKCVGAASCIIPECGIVLPDPEDAPALGAALERILSDPEARLRMGKVGREIAKNHTFERMCTQFLDLYRECISNEAPNVA